MKAQEKLIFTKQELLDRLAWVNNIRLLFGLFFFINFSVLLFFKIYVSPGYEIGLILGLYLFVYALFSKYYLTVQKQISLGELIFLSVFLSALDLLFITGYIYFTGAAESPHFIFYLLSLTSIPLIFPYFPQSVFIWSLAATALYDGMLFMHLISRPFIPGFVPGSERSLSVVYRLTLINGVGVPIMLFFFSGISYYISIYFNKLRKRFDKMAIDDLRSREHISSLANISWVLTRIYDFEKMLEQVLEETFKILKVSSGAIFIFTPGNHHYEKKVSLGVPDNLIKYCFSLNPNSKFSNKDSELRKIMSKEHIKEVVTKQLTMPNGKIIGSIFFPVKEDEDISRQGFMLLDSIISELSISITYALFSEKVNFFKKKGGPKNK